MDVLNNMEVKEGGGSEGGERNVRTSGGLDE